MPGWNPVNALLIRVDGAELPDDSASLLLSAFVENSLSLPDGFTLVFRDPFRSVLSSTGIKVGSIVSINVLRQGSRGGDPLIEGAEVTALEAEFAPNGTLTIVRGMDKSFRAFGGRRVEVYRNSTLSDAARTVASRAGLRVGRIDATRKVYTNLTQNNVSDWAFVKSLAREVGYDAWVKDGELNFCQPTNSSEGPASGRLGSDDPLQLTLKDDLISFRCALTAGQQVQDVKVRGWDPATKQSVIGSAQAQSSGASASLTPGELARKVGNASYLSVEIPRDSQEEADVAAKVIAETIGGSSAVFEGVAIGNPKLNAGTAISLGLVGEPFDGRYTLTDARHHFEADGYTTWFSVSGRNDRSLLGLMNGAAGRDDPVGGRRIPGVVIGIVTNNNDPDGLCRVKLKFPWLSDDYETDWARNAQVWAGNGYGSVIVPEVNDEVLLAFEQGDIHRPYVIGGLYNGTDKPHEGTPALIDSAGKVSRRDFVSRTGHVLSMTELEGQNDGIIIKTAGDGYKVELSKQQKTVTVEADGSIVIEAKGTGAMTIKAAGDLQISGRKVSIKGQTGVSIDGGGGNVEVKAGPKVAVQAAQVEVAGSASADLKGGGMVNIAGALVKINS